MPICDEYDIDMCVHPDDPPYEILGLPRIVTDEEDIRWFLNAVPNPHNGLTFCAGSLSAGGHNNLTPLAQEFHNRTHFVHLRSCHIFPDGNFTEASHLGGRADIIELTRIFEQEDEGLQCRLLVPRTYVRTWTGAGHHRHRRPRVGHQVPAARLLRLKAAKKHLRKQHQRLHPTKVQPLTLYNQR